MKKFEMPEIQVEVFAIADVITVSATDTEPVNPGNSQLPFLPGV